MPAKLRHLLTKSDRLKQEQAAMLRAALASFEGEMPSAVRELRAHIDRLTASRNGWTFIMLSPDQNAAVVDYLASHSSRPVVAMRLWALLFQHVDSDTGAICLRRDEIAGRLGIALEDVSRVMTELQNVGAIIRHRERVAGMRGPGVTTYFMNPLVGTHLAGAERDAAQAAASPGPLQMIQGGKAG
jgi:CRP-like cAMP-binding protein